MATPAAAAAAAAAASGQLSEAEWQEAVVLFCQWWREACPQHPPWVLHDVVMPVTCQVKQFLQLERPVVAADRAPPCRSSSTNSAPAQQSGLAASMAPAAAGQPLTATGDALPASSSDGLQKASASTLSDAATAAATAAAVRSIGSTEGNTSGLCKEQLGVDSRSQTASAVGVDSSQLTAAVGVDCTSPAAADDALEALDEATSLQPGPACSDDTRAPTQQQQQQQQPPWRQCHMHKYSVVWHDIYRVPVLYLAACRTDGCPLSLVQLCEDLPHLADYQEAGQASWTFLTATAHPVTVTPCFMLHPCQTAARMQLLLHAAAEGAPGNSAAEPPSLSATAAAAAADLGVVCAGDGNQGQFADRAELLTYARGWFSMVLPLLGLSMLRG